MFVSQTAFYAHKSDRHIGGTYMTLLNTFTNLGKPEWLDYNVYGEKTNFASTNVDPKSCAF